MELNYLTQEKSKAAEEYKRNIMEYRAFLESCEFIKVCENLKSVKKHPDDLLMF